MNTRVYPPGSRFLPTDLGLVKLHLRNMVDKNESGFITTLDMYKDEPWLLNHVHNVLFKRNEWYYFSPRTRRGGITSNRTVRGKGESEAGTWKSTNLKVEIKDKNKKIEGYRQNFVYCKKVKGGLENTCWRMTEYCLHKEIHDDLVLCHIRVGDKAEKKVMIQVQDEEAGLIDYANRIEMMMLQEATQQQQEQEKDTLILPCLPDESQDSKRMMTTQNNHNNFMTMSHQDHNQLDDFDFAGAEDVMIDIDEFINV